MRMRKIASSGVFKNKRIHQNWLVSGSYHKENSKHAKMNSEKVEILFF